MQCRHENGCSGEATREEVVGMSWHREGGEVRWKMKDAVKSLNYQRSSAKDLHALSLREEKNFTPSCPFRANPACLNPPLPQVTCHRPNRKKDAFATAGCKSVFSNQHLILSLVSFNPNNAGKNCLRTLPSSLAHLPCIQPVTIDIQVSL
jgi:hypothetical protein